MSDPRFIEADPSGLRFVKPQKVESRFIEDLAQLDESGKSGVFTDTNGHKYRLDNGRRVPLGDPAATTRPAGTPKSATGDKHARRKADAEAAGKWAETAQPRPASKEMAEAEKTVSVAHRRRALHGVRNEAEFATAIEGHNLPDSKPADVLYMQDAAGKPITDPDVVRAHLKLRAEAVQALTSGKYPGTGGDLTEEARTAYANRLALPCEMMEMKTLIISDKNSVRINRKALAAKLRESRRVGASFSVVIVDDRKGQKHSGNRLYVAPHALAKTVRLDQCEPAKDHGDVLKRIRSQEDRGRRQVIDLINQHQSENGGAK